MPGWTNNNFIASLVAGLIVLVIGTCATILWNKLDRLETRVGAAEVELGKVTQRIADGGTHDIVSQLQSSQKPEEVSATMALVSAQIRVSRAHAKAPDQSKIAAVVPAIVSATEKYPHLDQSWETISELASYRTESVVIPSSTEIPVCDSKNAKAEPLEQTRDHGLGYYFHDCRLMLNKLPGKSKPMNIQSADYSGPARMGVLAYLKNVTLELGPEGVSDTDILRFLAENCRFEFNVQHEPDVQAQRLLIAALQSKVAGNGELALP